LDAATLLLPSQALTAIDNLRALAGKQCMIMSADRGFFSEQDLREQGLPAMAPESRFFLPVNGHALARNAERQEGSVVHWQPCRDSPLISVQQFSNCPDTRLSQQSVAHTLSNGHDTTVRHLSQLAFASSDVPNLNQLMTLLRLSGYDTQLFLRCLPVVYDALTAMDSTQRRSWREAIVKGWDRLYWFEEINTQLLDLGVLAMRLSAWETARQIFGFLLTQHPECADSRYYLVATLLHHGHRTEALRLATQSLAMRADCQQMPGLHRYVVSCQTQSESDPVYDPDWCGDGELSLQPLGTHYTDEFLHQYRDPSIAVMTSLPSFETLQQFDQWLDEQTALPHKSTYAVVHRTYGLVGVVSASRHQRDAFFYFWIGADYQNQGYGQRAATLLFKMLEKTVAIEQVFTSVFEDNSRSLRALAALGFEDLAVRAQEPDSDCVFFVRTSTRYDARTQHQRLSRLLNEIESPLVLQPLHAT
jgi:RimJ/RimL family protein N-acetyltransferase